MEPYPHRYKVLAAGEADGVTRISAPGLPTLETAPPRQYGGPGDRWSPECLLVGAAADCFLLTFRAVATASSFVWRELRCEAEGILDHVDHASCFTQLNLSVRLVIPSGRDAERAQRLLEKAEKTCLVTNSLSAEVSLTCVVEPEL